MEFMLVTDAAGVTHLVNVNEIANVSPPANTVSGVGSEIHMTTGVILYHADDPSTFASTTQTKFGTSFNLNTY